MKKITLLLIALFSMCFFVVSDGLTHFLFALSHCRFSYSEIAISLLDIQTKVPSSKPYHRQFCKNSSWCQRHKYLQLTLAFLTIDTNINQFIKVYHNFYKLQQKMLKIYEKRQPQDVIAIL